MTDTLGAHKNSIYNVIVVTIYTLASVKDHWETIFLLGFSDSLHKIYDRRHIVFLIDHIKAYDKF